MIKKKVKVLFLLKIKIIMIYLIIISFMQEILKKIKNLDMDVFIFQMEVILKLIGKIMKILMKQE